jgi:hypothetical protein
MIMINSTHLSWCDVDVSTHVREDLPTFNVREDLPTFNVREDLPTFNVRKDLPTFNVREDLPPSMPGPENRCT